MPFNGNTINEPIGVSNNPLIKSLFVRTFDVAGFTPPPSGSYIITEITEDDIITETGDKMITE